MVGTSLLQVKPVNDNSAVHISRCTPACHSLVQHMLVFKEPMHKTSDQHGTMLLRVICAGVQYAEHVRAFPCSILVG